MVKTAGTGRVTSHVRLGVTSAAGSPKGRRIDRLAEAVDLCSNAKDIADALDEKLLAYLLAMAIQETRAAMRSEVAAAAKGDTKPLPRRGPRVLPSKR